MRPGQRAVLERLALAAVVRGHRGAEQQERRAARRRERGHGELGALEHADRADTGVGWIGVPECSL